MQVTINPKVARSYQMADLDVEQLGALWRALEAGEAVKVHYRDAAINLTVYKPTSDPYRYDHQILVKTSKRAVCSVTPRGGGFASVELLASGLELPGLLSEADALRCALAAVAGYIDGMREAI